MWRHDAVGEAEFKEGAAITTQPFRTLLVRADDSVMIEEHSTGDDRLHVTGEKHYHDKDRAKQPARKTMKFTSVNDHFELAVAGDSKWRSMETTRDVLVSWLGAIRKMQATGGSCLERGTCFVQCTYLESENACSSDFCTATAVEDEATSSWLNWIDISDAYYIVFFCKFAELNFSQNR